MQQMNQQTINCIHERQNSTTSALEQSEHKDESNVMTIKGILHKEK
jgi:hypothetical protein